MHLTLFLYGKCNRKITGRNLSWLAEYKQIEKHTLLLCAILTSPGASTSVLRHYDTALKMFSADAILSLETSGSFTTAFRRIKGWSMLSIFATPTLEACQKLNIMAFLYQ